MDNQQIQKRSFLSDKYRISSKSSWNKQQIQVFCKKYLSLDTFKVFWSKDNSSIIQSTNVFDEKKIKTLFIKCVPEFSIETDTIGFSSQEKTSKFDLNRFCVDMLNSFRNKKD